jgi:chaperonin cofactor prefoldin
MYQSSRILGDINETEPKEDIKQPSRSAAPWDSMHPSGPTATEIPLTHDEPTEPRTKSPRRTNGGVGGVSGKNLRTDWSERPSIHQPRERKQRGSTVAALFLLLAIAGLAWYFYPQLMTSYQNISHFPAMEEAMKSLEARANTTETQLRSLTENWGSLNEHLTKLDRRVSTGLASARHYVDKEVGDAQTQLVAELNQRTEAMNARVDKVESEQADTRSQLAQTQDQVQKQVSDLRQQVAELSSHTDQNVAKLEQEVGQNQNGLDALGQKVNRRRVDFEVAQNVTVELAPGVSLTVLKTNISYQSFDGFLSLKDEGKTVWLSSAGISRAVSFYPEPSDPPYDLVVTKIGPKGVVGYLMVPEALSQG